MNPCLMDLMTRLFLRSGFLIALIVGGLVGGYPFRCWK
jgi:hypothetical protein